MTSLGRLEGPNAKLPKPTLRVGAQGFSQLLCLDGGIGRYGNKNGWPDSRKHGLPRTMLQETRRRISAMYGWDCPLTFLYPNRF